LSGAGPRDGSGPRMDDDLISLTVEEDGEIRRLVRRRATMARTRARRFEDVTLEDPVVLIEGKLDISFVFRACHAGWHPRVVREAGPENGCRHAMCG